MEYVKIISRIFIVSIIVLAFKCSESHQPTSTNPTASTNPNEQKIIGEWNWIKTSGGFFPQEYFPPPTVTAVFETNHICSFYRNDTIISKRNFTLTREKLFLASDTLDIITFTDIISDSTMGGIYLPGIDKKIYLINDSLLIIDDIGYDMGSYYYVKMK